MATFNRVAGVLAAALLLVPAAKAAQTIERTSGLPGDDNFLAVVVLPNGDIVTAGERPGAQDYDTQGWVRRTDAAGTVIWDRTFDPGGWDRFEGLAILPDGGVAAVGAAEPNDDGHSVAWVVRLRADGSEVWNRTFAGPVPGPTLFNHAQFDEEGELLLAGAVTRADGAQADVWLVQLNSLGEIVWETHFDNDRWDEARAAYRLPDGRIAVAGVTAQVESDQAALLALVDPSGSVDWTVAAGRGRNPAFYDILWSPAGMLVAVGAANDETGSRSALVVGVDMQGELAWHSFLSGPGRSAALALAIGGPDSIVAAGWTVNGENGLDGWTVAVDTSGNELWQQVFGGPGQDRFSAAAALPDEGWALAGSLTADAPALEDGWTVIINAPPE